MEASQDITTMALSSTKGPVWNKVAAGCLVRDDHGSNGHLGPGGDSAGLAYPPPNSAQVTAPEIQRASPPADWEIVEVEEEEAFVIVGDRVPS